MLTGLFFPLMLILLGLTSGVTSVSFGNCDYEQVIEVGKTYYVFNPNYPSSYSPDTNCRWTAKSDRPINMTCTLEIPASEQCNVDVVIIQISDVPGRRYCGTGNLSVISDGNQLITELHSGSSSGGGRFLCTLQTVTTDSDDRCRCGWKNPTRIVGGRDTGVNEYPMMAGLVNSLERRIFCGATIINTKQVITAAHCVEGRDYNTTGVVIGEHDTRRGDETNATRLFRVSSIVIHAQYSSNNQDYDVAIVNIDGTITFNELVGPVCLPVQHSQDSFAGNYVDILGWGTTGFAERTSDVLQVAQVHIITNRQCSKYYSHITTRQMCTLEQDKDTCQLDSGGPVLWTNPSTRRVVIVSTVSYGSACAGGEPAVNSRVGAYIDWILLQTPPGFKYCELE